MSRAIDNLHDQKAATSLANADWHDQIRRLWSAGVHKAETAAMPPKMLTHVEWTTVRRLVATLRDTTDSAATRTACVSIVGEK